MVQDFSFDLKVREAIEAMPEEWQIHTKSCAEVREILSNPPPRYRLIDHNPKDHICNKRRTYQLLVAKSYCPLTITSLNVKICMLPQNGGEPVGYDTALQAAYKKHRVRFDMNYEVKPVDYKNFVHYSLSFKLAYADNIIERYLREYFESTAAIVKIDLPGRPAIDSPVFHFVSNAGNVIEKVNRDENLSLTQAIYRNSEAKQKKKYPSKKQ